MSPLTLCLVLVAVAVGSEGIHGVHKPRSHDSGLTHHHDDSDAVRAKLVPVKDRHNGRGSRGEAPFKVKPLSHPVRPKSDGKDFELKHQDSVKLTPIVQPGDKTRVNSASQNRDKLTTVNRHMSPSKNNDNSANQNGDTLVPVIRDVSGDENGETLGHVIHDRAVAQNHGKAAPVVLNISKNRNRDDSNNKNVERPVARARKISAVEKLNLRKNRRDAQSSNSDFWRCSRLVLGRTDGEMTRLPSVQIPRGQNETELIFNNHCEGSVRPQSLAGGVVIACNTMGSEVPKLSIDGLRVLVEDQSGDPLNVDSYQFCEDVIKERLAKA